VAKVFHDALPTADRSATERIFEREERPDMRRWVEAAEDE